LHLRVSLLKFECLTQKSSVMSMLHLSQSVLKKVSFDKRLFKKELLKAKRWLKKEEQLLLRAWCLATFAGVYDEVILEAFA